MQHPAAAAATLAAADGGPSQSVQALADALKQYRSGQGLQGAAGALTHGHREPAGSSGSNWFSVPNR